MEDNKEKVKEEPIKEEIEEGNDAIKDIIDNDMSADEIVLGEFGSKVRTYMALFCVLALCILALIMGTAIIISEYRNGEFPEMGWSFNIIIIILGIIGWEYVGVNKTINTLNGFKNGLIGRLVSKRK